MMKVLLLIKNFDFGGAENHVCELANALHNAGCNVWVVSSKGNQQSRLNTGIVHITMKFTDFNVIKKLYALVQLIRHEKFDIIHAHQHLTILAATVAGKITKVPVIATIHGRIRHDIPFNFEKKAIKKVIAISENSLKGLKHQPLLIDKSVLVYNGVSFPELCKSESPSELSIYYASRIDKRHSELISRILIEVWPTISAKYATAKFVIIGDGEYKNKLVKLVNSNKNLKKSVRLAGFCPNIAAEISKASLVLGVGRVAIKSLANSIPVFSIKFNRSGGLITTKNFAKLSYGNFVAIDGFSPTSTEIIKTIDDFISNQQFYKQEAIAIQKQMKELYSIEKVTQLTLKLYHEVVSSTK